MISQPKIVIAGGGHAGVEAALACSRMGIPVVLVTMDINAIVRASCNPAIGGLAKGHLVKEIDALGGEMGFATDMSGIQFKMLNKSKGRAVWSPRAQIDKLKYTAHMQQVLFHSNNIQVVQGEVAGFKTDKHKITSAVLKDGSVIDCNALIVTSGTFQSGLIHIGSKTFQAGRFGEPPSEGLTEAMKACGMWVGRLKTGTPPRILRASIDWSKTESAPGDRFPEPFSVRTPLPFTPPNQVCHIAYTNNDCHSVLMDSLHESAMYSGRIQGVGPRYCPSIEDKVVRFSGRDKHQLFLEPEWVDSKQIYINGFSTSMPQDVQERALHLVPGLEHAEFIRPGYAIEYDYVHSSQLKSTLESKNLDGLFLAGQINGTSGYEEAAAQGLIAGVNACLQIRDDEPFVLRRNEAYIGVLIDDLITKAINDPYRMFTSRAEYRLTLRPDTADFRLTEKGYRLGLISEPQYQKFMERKSGVFHVKQLLENNRIRFENSAVKKSASEIILNPKYDISDLKPHLPELNGFRHDVLFTAETDLKYAGYIERENRRVDQMKSLEYIEIPKEFDFHKLNNISYESREKLSLIRPETLGQASRIAGVSPADVAVLSIYLKR